ncbi:hypothetical protein JTB14_004715 [Gonioctena quinquepunctata]|nr:hypothetical protein JTB14_004715 [Gonioctena quinquepunctata]
MRGFKSSVLLFIPENPTRQENTGYSSTIRLFFKMIVYFIKREWKSIVNKLKPAIAETIAKVASSIVNETDILEDAEMLANDSRVRCLNENDGVTNEVNSTDEDSDEDQEDQDNVSNDDACDE